MQFIKRSEAVRQIYMGSLFTMEFVTADEKRGTGGDLIKVIDWQLAQKVEARKQPGAADSGHRKNPNHDAHETICICNPDNIKLNPITVHIRLIQTFNGKTILNG